MCLCARGILLQAYSRRQEFDTGLVCQRRLNPCWTFVPKLVWFLLSTSSRAAVLQLLVSNCCLLASSILKRVKLFLLVFFLCLSVTYLFIRSIGTCFKFRGHEDSVCCYNSCVGSCKDGLIRSTVCGEGWSIGKQHKAPICVIWLSECQCVCVWECVVCFFFFCSFVLKA